MVLFAQLVEPFIITNYTTEDESESKWYEGKGKAIYEDGNVYEGEFKNGVIDGCGKFEWKNSGVLYEGEFKQNIIDGHGKLQWNNGFTYDGMFQNGRRHGHGVLENQELGYKYEGEWNMSQFHGYGVLSINSKFVFRGNWDNGKKNGKGSILYESGNSYDGEWKNDVREGFGTMIWKDRMDRYVGDWKNGIPDGVGQYTWQFEALKESKSNPLRNVRTNHYEGEWNEGRRHGKGTFFYADGAKYIGDWFDNKKHGFGVFTYADGRTFKGEFRDDAKASETNQKLDAEFSSIGIKLCIQDIMEQAGPDAKRSLKDIENVLTRNQPMLRDVYTKSCNITSTRIPGSIDEGSSIMQAFQFWTLCRVCNLLDGNITVPFLNRLLATVKSSHDAGADSHIENKLDPSKTKIHDPCQAILYREFAETLVRLAYWKYSIEYPDLTLASLLSRLLAHDIAPFTEAEHDMVESCINEILPPHSSEITTLFKLCESRLDENTNDTVVTTQSIVDMFRNKRLLNCDLIFRVPATSTTEEKESDETANAEEKEVDEIETKSSDEIIDKMIQIQSSQIIRAVSKSLNLEPGHRDALYAEMLVGQFTIVLNKLADELRDSQDNALGAVSNDCIIENILRNVDLS